MRYLLQPGIQPGTFICTDTENKIVCHFQKNKFNETQKFTFLEDAQPTLMMLAKIMREMGDYLAANHRDIV